MVPRDKFVAAVMSCVGTPVRHMGRVIGAGLDCVGVPIASLFASGGPFITTPPYGNPPGAGALWTALNEHARQIDIDDREPGDLLVMLWKGEPRHVAVFVGHDRSGRIVGVRADGGAGKVVHSSLPSSARIATCWQLKEVA